MTKLKKINIIFFQRNIYQILYYFITYLLDYSSNKNNISYYIEGRNYFVNFFLNKELYEESDFDTINLVLTSIDNCIFSKTENKDSLLNLEIFQKLFSFSYIIQKEKFENIDDSNYMNIMRNFLSSCKNQNQGKKNIDNIIDKLCSKVFLEKNINIIYGFMNLVFELDLSKKINNNNDNISNILLNIILCGDNENENYKKTCIIMLKIVFELYIILEDNSPIKEIQVKDTIKIDAMIEYGKRYLLKKKDNNDKLNEFELKEEEESITKILDLNNQLFKKAIENFSEKDYLKINEFLLLVSQSINTLLFQLLFSENYSLCYSFYYFFFLNEEKKTTLSENIAKKSILELSNKLLFFHPAPFIFIFLKQLIQDNFSESTLFIEEIIKILEKNYQTEKKEEKKLKIFYRNANIINTLVLMDYLLKTYGNNLEKEEDLIKRIIFRLNDLLIKTGLIFSPWQFLLIEYDNSGLIKKPICEIIIDILFKLYSKEIKYKNEEIIKEIEKICYPLNNKEHCLFYIIDCTKNISKKKNSTPISDERLFNKIKKFNTNLNEFFPNKYFKKNEENKFDYFNFCQYFLGKFIIQDKINPSKLLDQENDFLYKICEKILKDCQILVTNSDSYTPNDSDFELYNIVKKITGDNRKIGLKFGELKQKIDDYLGMAGKLYYMTKKEIYAYRCMEITFENRFNKNKSIINEDSSPRSIMRISINNNSKSFSSININNSIISKKSNSNMSLINLDLSLNKGKKIPDCEVEENFDFLNSNYIVFNPKRDFLCNTFSIEFKDIFFYNEKFVKMKMYYNSHFQSQKETKVLNYPSKIKNFSYKGFPPLFLSQDSHFFDSIFFHISHLYFEEFKNKIKEKKIKFVKKNLNFPKKHSFNCELISRERSLNGLLYVCDSYFIFKTSEIDINNDLYIFAQFTYTEEKEKKEKTLIIFFDDIKTIISRRVMLIWIGIEIFLKNGKSYFFNFYRLSHFQQFNAISQETKLKEKIIKLKDKNIKKYTTKWKKREISTLYYLLKLNYFSSRSFNDATQYPIFPWILKDYTKLNSIFENNKIEDSLFRIFKYPISLQEEKLRLNAINKFEDENNIEEESAHLGTHYSTSSYIFYYLMRQNPFMQGLIKLQNYSQENTNRMFYSIYDCLATILDGHDSREIIPEFFLKIEYFINLNCSDFGKKFDKTQLDDVNMNICSDHSFSLSLYIKFIIQHFLLINGNQILNVNNSITQWIDNIFGVNQYPDKAKESCNIFHSLSYEKNSSKIIELDEKIVRNNLLKIDSEKERNELKNEIGYIVNFGVCPSKILNEILQGRNDKKIENNIQYGQNKIDRLININIYNNEIFYLEKKGERIYLKEIELKNTFQLFEREKENGTIYLKDHSYSYTFIKEKNKIITCKYIDNSIKIHNLNNTESNTLNETKEIKIIFDEFICCCKSIPKTNIILLGTKSGKLIKFDLENKEIKNKIKAHEDMINIIEINSILKIIITSGDDNYIYLRKLYDFELITFIKIQQTLIVKTIKITEMNLIYCLCNCINLKKEEEKNLGIQSVILGYTLCGIQFAKSLEIYANDFFFTEKLNIIYNSVGSDQFVVLNGHDLCLKGHLTIKNYQSNYFYYNSNNKMVYYEDNKHYIKCDVLN